MTDSRIDTSKQDANDKGEAQGRADALAGKPNAAPQRDGSGGADDYYADGYEYGYRQALSSQKGAPGRTPQNGDGQKSKPAGDQPTFAHKDGTTLRVDQVEKPMIELDDPKDAGLALLISSGGQAVDPGRIEQRITAPSGMVFNDYLSATYFSHAPVPDAEQPSYRLEDGGRVMVITGNPHVRTNEADKDGWLYGFTVRATSDAKPGKRKDGRAEVGSAEPVALIGAIV